MESSLDHAAVLACHPDSPCIPVRAIGARLRRTPEGALALAYTVEGDAERLRLPPRAPQRFADGLWQHTCFELFVARAGLPAYHEFNFSPSSEWAAYAFSAYRVAVPLPAEKLAPPVAVRFAPRRLKIETGIRLDLLSPALVTAKLRLGVSAVIEDESGHLSYWALHHPPGKPDFHHAEAFVLELDEIRH